MLLGIDVRRHRQPAYPIHPLLLERWSPRAMSGEPLPEEAIATLFEAARWAPSGGNGQPWRFLYARREGPHWATFLDLLVPANRRWAERAAVLAVVVSRTTSERSGKPVGTHAYDAGAAWMALALEGAHLGLVVHGMAGFDYDLARQSLAIPEDHAVQAMFAVGRPGKIEELPEDLREREVPSGRKSVAEFAWEGEFPATPQP